MSWFWRLTRMSAYNNPMSMSYEKSTGNAAVIEVIEVIEVTEEGHIPFQSVTTKIP